MSCTDSMLMLYFIPDTNHEIMVSLTVNSLPENAIILVNHRIAIQDSVKAVKDHYVQLLDPWAKERSFRFCAFGTESPHEDGNCTPPTNTLDSGDLTLSAHYELEPSPVSSAEDSGFALLAGTIKGVFGDVVVAPMMLSGNTGKLVLRKDCSIVASFKFIVLSRTVRVNGDPQTHDTTGIYRHRYIECPRGGQVTIPGGHGCTPSTSACPSKVLWRWFISTTNSSA